MKFPAFLLPLSLLALVGLAVSFSGCETSQPRAAFTPAIPKTWDEEALATLEVPLADPNFSARHVSTDYYYRIPVRPIYKSYPVYHPDREPAVYLEELRRKEPEIIWDDRGKRPKLATRADWIRAGEQVFDAPISYSKVTPAFRESYSKRLRTLPYATLADGRMPYDRYVIREKG